VVVRAPAEPQYSGLKRLLLLLFSVKVQFTFIINLSRLIKKIKLKYIHFTVPYGLKFRDAK